MDQTRYPIRSFALLDLSSHISKMGLVNNIFLPLATSSNCVT